MKFITAIMVSLLLSGCGFLGLNKDKDKKPETAIVYQTKYIVISPDADMLLPTKKTPPPNRKEYTDLNEFDIAAWRVKEKLLSEAYIKQSGAVDQCNFDKKAISSFIEKSKAQYKDK